MLFFYLEKKFLFFITFKKKLAGFVFGCSKKTNSQLNFFKNILIKYFKFIILDNLVII